MDMVKTQYAKKRANFVCNNKSRDHSPISADFEKIRAYSVCGNRMYQIRNSDGVPMYSGPEIHDNARKVKKPIED
jgi:hypothetical protein